MDVTVGTQKWQLCGGTPSPSSTFGRLRASIPSKKPSMSLFDTTYAMTSELFAFYTPLQLQINLFLFCKIFEEVNQFGLEFIELWEWGRKEMEERLMSHVHLGGTSAHDGRLRLAAHGPAGRRGQPSQHREWWGVPVPSPHMLLPCHLHQGGTGCGWKCRVPGVCWREEEVRIEHTH